MKAASITSSWSTAPLQVFVASFAARQPCKGKILGKVFAVGDMCPFAQDKLKSADRFAVGRASQSCPCPL